MNKQVFEMTDTSSSQSYVTGTNKLVKKAVGMVAMFSVCLLVCHSLGLIHQALSYFSP
ncbi:hypothetical protein Sta7437_4780 (plasmid) [Stanieria cyanosphaera PCC 7437]|uniref:Uncharacterized protein n=1 Tax=Stanieria cyanosphaera (strain ATCC 29371 / PCC 7437) TaxID=111780 RepID=K9Y0E9_STAC7|nr:hypothetical protein [Stanieria cyanosphaera]AFZ38218.1 hypothetical protein Sta7437_4780 [Stanieria cyanosphaera PCC 7437]